MCAGPVNFHRFYRPSLVVGLIVLGLICAVVWRRVGRRPPHSPAAAAAVVETLPPRLRQLQQRLASGSATDPGVLLAELEKALHAVPKSEAVAALIALLDSGLDAKTGLKFKVGPGGNLGGAPTLRVWMLDQLGRLDAAAAADYAGHIYARHDSADEWAIALRNDWREAAPTGRIGPVRARALELINDTEWAKEPSVGFLQALDLSVATMAWEAVPTLEKWLGPSQPTALRGGAWIALDRLTMEVPADFLPVLAQHRDWLTSQPMMRAGLMARADLAAESERKAVETYVLRDDVAATERERFFELLPNVSATVSYNLVTTARTPTPHQAARLDQAALAGVREWRAQQRFARLNSELITAETRLSESVASAVRGGYLQP